MQAFFSLLLFLFGPTKNNLTDCQKCAQDTPYLCAANMLSMNHRLCMDMTEVSGRMYKMFLLDLKEAHGSGSPEYQSAVPNWKLWEQVYPGYTAKDISKEFFEKSTFSLAPIVGISYEQAILFTDWRTESFKKELAQMDTKTRSQFPKDFVFRLPTPAEWSRIRFMTQEKSMLKQVSKIAASLNKEYGLKKNKLLYYNPKIQTIFSGMDENLGLFHVHDNVAEMTSEKGVAMGGSFHQKGKPDFMKKTNYEGEQTWLGFRNIFEIIE